MSRGEDAPPPTILDVAREAAVSKTTASDALRGSGRVSQATRDAVALVASRLGYSPNRSARSLRTSVTETIGLHIPEFLTRSEYYMSFVFGVVEQARLASYNVTLITSGHLPQRGAVPQVDGLVLCDPVADDPVVEHLMGTTLPIVTAERYVGESRPTGIVWSDHEALARQLFDHIHNAGATRPALLASGTTSDWSTTLQRTHAEWSVENGLPRIAREAPFGSPPHVLQAAVRDLLAASPEIDAIVCAADGAAVAVLPEIRAAGRTVGKDILLASCVDSSAMQHADPPITAIDLRPRTLGMECARLLCEILAGEVASDTVRTMPIELRIRDSTRS